MTTQTEKIDLEKNKEKGQMDLNIIANNLNDDCLSYIYSFVNTRQICFNVLKRKHNTILTNYILLKDLQKESITVNLLGWETEYLGLKK